MTIERTLCQIVHELDAVDDVLGQAIEPPAEDGFDLSGPHLAHHLAEYRAARLARRSALLVHLTYVDTTQRRHLAQFLELCWNRKDLAVLAVHGAAGVDDMNLVVHIRLVPYAIE